MKQKKHNEIINQAIKLLNQVDNMEELEERLEIKIDPVMLSEISKELKTRKKKLAAVKRKYAARGERNLVQEGKIKIEAIEKLQKKIKSLNRMNYIDKNLDEKTKLKREKKQLIKKIEIENAWLNEETRELFNNYQNLVVHGDRIDILHQLIFKYIENVQDLLELEVNTTSVMKEKEQENKPTIRNRFYPSFSKKRTSPTKEFYIPYENKLQTIIEKAKTSKHMITWLGRLEEIESQEKELVSGLEMTTDKLIAKREFIVPKNEIERQYKQVLKRIDSDYYLNNWHPDDLEVIPKEIKTLLNNMVYLPKYELEELTIIAISLIKNKKSRLNKNQDFYEQEKNLLNNLKHSFESIKPLIYIEEEDTSSYYEILKTLIQDDRNYEQIREIIKIEEFKRARQSSNEKDHNSDKKHIILLLEDYFIDNYKIKLLNHGFEYIEPDFYKEIMKAIITEGIKLTSKEVAEYSRKIDEFRDYIYKKGYQSNNKIMEDIREISNLRQVHEKKEKKQKSGLLSPAEQKENFNLWLSIGVNENKEKDYKEFYPSATVRTFQIEGLEPFAFSIAYLEDGSKNFGVHILDTSKIIREDENMMTELIENNITLPTFTKHITFPTMSFQSNINAENELSKGPVCPTNLMINNYFSKEDLNKYKGIPELKEFKNWLYLIRNDLMMEENIYQADNIKSLISTYLSEKLSTKFEKEKLPFIYKSAIPDQEKIIMENHNNTSQLLSKIPRNKAHQVYDILESKELASTYYIGNKTNNGKIELDTTTPAGVYLLTTLHRIREGRYNPDKAEKEIVNLLSYLNKGHDYIPQCLSTQNERQVAKMVRQYKRNNQGKMDK